MPRRCLYTSIQRNKLGAIYLQWLPKNQASYSARTKDARHIDTPTWRSCPKRSAALPRACVPHPPQLFGATLPGHGGKHGPADPLRQGCVPTPGQASPPSLQPQARPITITSTHSAQKHIFNPFYLTSSAKDTAAASAHPKKYGGFAPAPLLCMWVPEAEVGYSTSCSGGHQRWVTWSRRKAGASAWTFPWGNWGTAGCTGTFTETVCAASSPGRRCSQKYSQLRCDQSPTSCQAGAAPRIWRDQLFRRKVLPFIHLAVGKKDFTDFTLTKHQQRHKLHRCPPIPEMPHLRGGRARTLQHSVTAPACHSLAPFYLPLIATFYTSSNSQHLIASFAVSQICKPWLSYTVSPCFKIHLTTAVYTYDGCVHLSNDLKNKRNAKYYLSSWRNGHYSSF